MYATVCIAYLQCVSGVWCVSGVCSRCVVCSVTSVCVVYAPVCYVCVAVQCVFVRE